VAPNRGFALLEALVASTLLVVGVLSLAQIFTLAARADITAHRLTMASLLAAQKVEELRSLPWSVSAEGVDRVQEFTRRWSVTPLGIDPSSTAVIRVSVTPGAVRLITLRARPP
jgi:Tfp pilus assembly protein PilV